MYLLLNMSRDNAIVHPLIRSTWSYIHDGATKSVSERQQSRLWSRSLWSRCDHVTGQTHLCTDVQKSTSIPLSNTVDVFVQYYTSAYGRVREDAVGALNGRFLAVETV